jgi:CBS domain-containing protein
MTDQPARGSAEQQPSASMPAPWTVLWTRGGATAEIAAMLCGGTPVRVEGELREACVEARADALVTKKLTSFDLVNTVVPHRVEPDDIGGVAAAVGSGPNSGLAAGVAHRIATHLGVRGMLVTAPAPGATRAEAHRLLADLGRQAPGFDRRLQVDGGAPSIVEGLAPGTLLVIGEPGGSWIHRQFFGPGRKLIHAAPTGALVVRSAPMRCFQVAGEPSYLGAVMRSEDAAQLMGSRVVPVVDDGRLVGIARRTALVAADPDTPVVEVMESPVALDQDDPVDAAWGLAALFEGAPIPVVAPDGTLWGTVDPRSIGIGDAAAQ